MTNKTASEQLQIRKVTRGQFALCGSCLWCASVFRSGSFTECPACRIGTLDFMPISADENYVFDYDEKRGIVIDFAPAKRK